MPDVPNKEHTAQYTFTLPKAPWLTQKSHIPLSCEQNTGNDFCHPNQHNAPPEKTLIWYDVQHLCHPNAHLPENFVRRKNRRLSQSFTTGPQPLGHPKISLASYTSTLNPPTAVPKTPRAPWNTKHLNPSKTPKYRQTRHRNTCFFAAFHRCTWRLCTSAATPFTPHHCCPSYTLPLLPPLEPLKRRRREREREGESASTMKAYNKLTT